MREHRCDEIQPVKAAGRRSGSGISDIRESPEKKGKAAETEGNHESPDRVDLSSKAACPLKPDEDPRKTAKTALEKTPGYDRLSDEQKERLLDLYEAHPDSRILESARTLIKDGRLTQGVTDQLSHLADPDFKLADGIDRTELLAQAMTDIASPQNIAQGGKGTCAATSVQIALAVKKPDRYLQILGALSSESGDASSLVKRDLLKIGPFSLVSQGLKRPDDAPVRENDGRSLTVRIMSPSFMDYANGILDYENKDDHSQIVGPIGIPGLLEGQTRGLYEGVMGVETKTVGNTVLNKLPLVGGFFRGSTFDGISKSLKDGKDVTVSLKWGDGGHQVYLQKLDDSYAYFINPWGEMDKMPIQDFKDHLLGATVSDKVAVTAPPPAAIENTQAYGQIDEDTYA